MVECPRDFGRRDAFVDLPGAVQRDRRPFLVSTRVRQKETHACCNHHPGSQRSFHFHSSSEHASPLERQRRAGRTDRPSPHGRSRSTRQRPRCSGRWVCRRWSSTRSPAAPAGKAAASATPCGPGESSGRPRAGPWRRPLPRPDRPAAWPRGTGNQFMVSFTPLELSPATTACDGSVPGSLPPVRSRPRHRANTSKAAYSRSVSSAGRSFQ